MKRAAEKGTWLKGRKKVRAGVVCAVALGPKAWLCELKSVDGAWATTLSSSHAAEGAAHRVRTYLSGARKRKNNLSAQATERAWRKTAKGVALQNKLSGEYRAGSKGKANSLLHNKKRRKTL